jgi:hypothetical protein
MRRPMLRPENTKEGSIISLRPSGAFPLWFSVPRVPLRYTLGYFQPSLRKGQIADKVILRFQTNALG